MHPFELSHKTTVLLTHWGRTTHICVGKLTTIGSDNGLSPGRRLATIWTNAVILFIGTILIEFSEILSKIHTFSFKEMHLKMSSAKWRPFVSASICWATLHVLSVSLRYLIHWMVPAPEPLVMYCQSEPENQTPVACMIQNAMILLT